MPELFPGPRHRRVKRIRRAPTSEKAFLAAWESSLHAGRIPGRPEAEDSLRELRELAVGAGARIVGSLLQRSPQPDPATLIGKGKLIEVRGAAHAAAADLVMFDHDLTPSQLRNLERELDVRVIDRTQLILDIFAGRARSREGQLQVELAQLNYLLPQLGGRGTGSRGWAAASVREAPVSSSWNMTAGAFAPAFARCARRSKRFARNALCIGRGGGIINSSRWRWWAIPTQENPPYSML